MGYLHIGNLYKQREILLFKECFAMEKVHGTSAHISWKEGDMHLFSGGEKHDSFIKFFNIPELKAKFQALGLPKVIVYGEAYGGKCQGMSGTYGKELRFIGFDVKIEDCWLNVEKAHKVCEDLGLEFVPYVRTTTDLTELDRLRDMPSEVAVRRGMGPDKLREGIVLRPLIEVTLNNRERVIAKHKGDAFKETQTARITHTDPAQLKILEDAEAIANEWVTEMRLTHILDKLQANGIALDISETKTVISVMINDVLREAKGEIVNSKGARRAISSHAAKMFKQRLNK